MSGILTSSRTQKPTSRQCVGVRPLLTTGFIDDVYHTHLPPGEVQGWRACVHTPSRVGGATSCTRKAVPLTYFTSMGVPHAQAAAASAPTTAFDPARRHMPEPGLPLPGEVRWGKMGKLPGWPVVVWTEADAAAMDIPAIKYKPNTVPVQFFGTYETGRLKVCAHSPLFFSKVAFQ